MTKLTTTLRTVAPYFAKAERYFSNVVPYTNVQDAVDSLVFSSNNPQKPANLVPVQVTAAMSPYTVQSTDYVIYAKTSTGPITIVFAAAATYGNLEREISDVDGAAGTNNVSLTLNGAEKIDNLAPYTIDTNYASVRLRPNSGAGFKVMS
jgi:hypothetical protein